MAITLTGTGPATIPADHISSSHTTYAFCTPVVTLAATYEAAGTFEFGVQLSEIVITNIGTKALAFRWPGQTADCGVVLPGDKVQMRRIYKSGISLRCAETGSSTQAVVFGL